MIDRYVLDAHSLIWHLEGNPKLGKTARTVMSDPNNRFVLPTIALAEAIGVVQNGRTMILHVADFWQDVLSDARIEIAPLTLEVLRERLNASAVPEMHDRLITATAIELEKQNLKVAILT